MGKLYVVRHADAGHRVGPREIDDKRELNARGWRQADALRAQLAAAGVTRLLSSPFVRCLQTLEPLAHELELPVEPDDRLAEGEAARGVLALAAEVRADNAVLCSHGDVIPDLLEILEASGTRLKGEVRWQKASTWVLTWDGDRLAKGQYVPPPG